MSCPWDAGINNLVKLFEKKRNLWTEYGTAVGSIINWTAALKLPAQALPGVQGSGIQLCCQQIRQHLASSPLTAGGAVGIPSHRLSKGTVHYQQFTSVDTGWMKTSYFSFSSLEFLKLSHCPRITHFQDPAQLPFLPSSLQPHEIVTVLNTK